MATTLNSLDIVYGGISGETALTLTGLWTDTDTFTVDVCGIAATSVVVVSNTEITCITGAITAGLQGDVVLTDTTASETTTLTNGFVYLNPGEMCLSQLILAAQQRADMEGSQFVNTQTWTSFINQANYYLYDLLIQTYGDDYYVASPHNFTTDGQNQFYALPVDFYKLLGVDLALSAANNAYATLKRFKFSDRNRNSINVRTTAYGATNLRYRLNGTKLMFNTIPSANQQARMWYAPRLTDMVLMTDVVDGVSGWTELVILEAAIRALIKEESDISALAAQRQDMVDRIKGAAESRDAAFSEVVGDVQSLDWNGYGNGFNGWDVS